MRGSIKNTAEFVLFVPPDGNLVILVVPVFVDRPFTKNQKEGT